MLAKCYTSALMGIDAYGVEVEVDISRGLPNFNIVGLPDTAVREAKERITAAIKNSQFNFPSGRITINLAPADIKKEGSSFDLPMAIGILKATGAIRKNELSSYIILGELALDGGVRRINGALPMVLKAKERKIKKIALPLENAREASVIKEIEVYPLENLSQTVKFLNEEIIIEPYKCDIEEVLKENSYYEVDFSEVKGQQHIKKSSGDSGQWRS